MPDPTQIETPEKIVDPAIIAQPTETPPPVVKPVVVVEEPEGGDGKVLQVKHGDFKRIKDEAKEKGRQEALLEYEAKAKKAGFRSLDEFLETAKKPTAPNPEPLVPPKKVTTAMPITPAPAPKPDKAAAEAAKLSDEKSRMRKQCRREEKQRRLLERQLAAKDAEMELRDELHSFGVADVDYGIRLLTRALQGKSEEELAKFDRKAFFEGIRQDRPYLFGERVQPATTGTNGAKPDGSNPVTPPAGGPAAAAAEANKFDARKATPQEVSDKLKSLGLNPHM